MAFYALGGFFFERYEFSHKVSFKWLAFKRIGRIDKENMAEGEGFEPSRLSPAGFQDRCTRPLCEPSAA